MTDQEALFFQGLLRKYPLRTIIGELIRHTSKLVPHETRWFYVRRSLQQAQFHTFREGSYDEPDFDSNESGRSLQARR